MQFGKSYTDIKKEPKGGGGGDFIRYPKKGESVTIRILDEPETWAGWWEHFDNGLKVGFPCTGDRDTCPGCNSSVERTAKASRKIAFNAVHTHNDKQYVNLWKVTRPTAEKLELRAKKDGTIRARDYTITGMDKDNGFTEYDVDGEDKEVVDLTDYDSKRKDLNTALVEAFESAFGEGSVEAVENGKVFRMSDAAAEQERKAEAKADEENEASFESSSNVSRFSDTKPTAKAEESHEGQEDPEIVRLKKQLAEAQEAREQAEIAKRKAEAPPGSARAQSGSLEDPPSEPEAEQDTEAEGVDEELVEGEVDPGEPTYNEPELRAMTMGRLREIIATEHKWGRLPEPPKFKKKDDLLDWLFDQA